MKFDALFEKVFVQSKKSEVKSLEVNKENVEAKYNKVIQNANFQKWFSGSKVTQRDGSPLLVYHGTAENFKFFDTEGSDLGAHFGTFRQSGNKNLMDDDRAKFARHCCFLRIENPLILKGDAGTWNCFRRIFDAFEMAGLDIPLVDDLWELPFSKDISDTMTASERNVVVELFKKHGYDGIKYQNFYEDVGRYSYLVFYPNQIKSLYNKGSFNPKSNNIFE